MIRGQSFCPGTFAGLPTSPMFCSKIGVQLGAPSAGYAQFALRFGTTSLTALTNTWATNLPDQRVQVDLSGTTITPPVPPAWVEYELKYPFLYTPGQGLVLDITSQAQAAGIYCRTSIGTGVARLVDTNYLGNPTAGAPSTSGGIKFRMVFEPLAIVSHGTGCPGSGSFVPEIASTGQSTVGSFNYAVTLAKALGGSAAVFALGDTALFDLGGGCKVYNSLLVTIGTTTSGLGAGNGTAAIPLIIPNNPGLLTAVVSTQFGILDPAGPGIIPFVFTPSGKIVIY